MHHTCCLEERGTAGRYVSTRAGGEQALWLCSSACVRGLGLATAVPWSCSWLLPVPTAQPLPSLSLQCGRPLQEASQYPSLPAGLPTLGGSPSMWEQCLFYLGSLYPQAELLSKPILKSYSIQETTVSKQETFVYIISLCTNRNSNQFSYF